MIARAALICFDVQAPPCGLLSQLLGYRVRCCLLLVVFAPNMTYTISSFNFEAPSRNSSSMTYVSLGIRITSNGPHNSLNATLHVYEFRHPPRELDIPHCCLTPHTRSPLVYPLLHCGLPLPNRTLATHRHLNPPSPSPTQRRIF